MVVQRLRDLLPRQDLVADEGEGGGGDAPPFVIRRARLRAFAPRAEVLEQPLCQGACVVATVDRPLGPRGGHGALRGRDQYAIDQTSTFLVKARLIATTYRPSSSP